MSSTTIESMANRVTISLPNMFKSFLVIDPVVNPNYESVREESESWLQSAMSLSAKEQKRVHYCDFSYFVSVLIPHAPREKLKIACDWGNWVFMFDDMFDEGELRNDPETSQRIILNLLSIMVPEAKRTSEEAVVAAHDAFYGHLVEGSSPSILKRYVNAMKAYCAGALQHVEDFAADRMPTISEMIMTRRMSIGVFPMYPLVEFAYDLSLPEEVFLHPTVQQLEILGAEFVMLMNDILSYRKEETEECPFNTVAVCRMNGASAQDAFDEIASMVDARFNTWNETVKALPSWGKETDAQLRQYVQGIQNIVQANISWSFRTGRYFGPKAEKVRQSREIDVLVQPSFLVG